jgi:hypothetical protein
MYRNSVKDVTGGTQFAADGWTDMFHHFKLPYAVILSKLQLCAQ